MVDRTQKQLEIILIRHGETAWNKEQRMQGHLDIEINAEGQRQAQALAACLAHEPLDAIFSSDMQRTQQTIAPLATTRGIVVQLDAQLRERCYGGFEGLRRPEIKSRFPHAYAALIERDVDARHPPGARIAETLNEFSKRCIEAFHSVIVKAKSHQRIAIITHQGKRIKYPQNSNQEPEQDIAHEATRRGVFSGC